jgi:hypothetical protein
VETEINRERQKGTYRAREMLVYLLKYKRKIRDMKKTNGFFEILKLIAG